MGFRGLNNVPKRNSYLYPGHTRVGTPSPPKDTSVRSKRVLLDFSPRVSPPIWTLTHSFPSLDLHRMPPDWHFRNWRTFARKTLKKGKLSRFIERYIRGKLSRGWEVTGDQMGRLTYKVTTSSFLPVPHFTWSVNWDRWRRKNGM